MSRDLNGLFRPRSVAVIGGSRDPRSMSGTPVRNLRETFPGPVYVVNPKAAAEGWPQSFASLGEVPDAVDLALIAVPAKHVVEVVRQCVAKPVRAIVLITAGFAELGEAGRAASDELLKLVRDARIPLVGPNCLGVVSTSPDGPLNASFGPTLPAPGPISLLTQSGGLGFVLVEYLRLRQLGLAELVSLGNKLDLDEADLLEYWLEHSASRAVALYLESYQRPRQLLDAARRFSLERPIVLLKAGRTAAGGRAAGSHTAALATPDRLADGLARQAGMVRVETLVELCETITYVARQPAPSGRRAAVVTNAGGPGVMLADALAARGWQLPEPTEATRRALREIAGPLASVRNPVDLVGTVEPELFARCLDVCFASDQFDVVIPLYVPRLPETSEPIVRAIRAAFGHRPADKAVAAVIMESEAELGRLQGIAEPIPCFQFPESLAGALERSARYATWRRERSKPEQVVARPAETTDADLAIDAELARQIEASTADWLPIDLTLRLLAAAGIAVPAWRLASDERGACYAAEELGLPVVLKAFAPGVIHKRAAGGVELDLRTTDEVASAARRLHERFGDKSTLLIQALHPASHEAFVGVSWTAEFGHALALGLGGSDVERTAAVSFRFPPLSPPDRLDFLADSSLANLAVTPERQLTPLGQVLSQLLTQVERLVARFPQLRELDLNPVALGTSSVTAIDARVRVGSG